MSGEVKMPPAFVHRPSGPLATVRGLGLFTPRSKFYWAPVPIFLIEHPGAGPFLVDTGLDPRLIDDARASLGAVSSRLYTVRMTPDQAASELVRSAGVDPEALELIVMTHMHFDHAGGVAQFPAATFAVSGEEWRAANHRGVTQGYHHNYYHPEFAWRTIDYDDDEIVSFESFARSVDLFGDGSVRLVFTPGHSMGHQSLILRLAGGQECLLCGDAAYELATIHDTVVPTILADEHLFRRSLREFQQYLEPRPSAVVIPGHDPGVWAELAEVYS
jgi:glyoxylase-like metal-dependent hydrolase (beta-lactamase superfamily II)